MNAIHDQLPGAEMRQEVLVMIPRINIHAFCTDPRTGQVLETAAADRRMAKAHMQVHPGGIAAAAEIYSQTETPNVLIVESQANRDGVLAELAQLAAVCDPSTKVIVIGHLNDVLLYRELTRLGISDYIVAPISSLQVIESVGNLYADPGAARIGRVIAFAGARGGTGASTIAHNVAWTIARTYALETTIVDLDVAFGTAALDFNVDPNQSVADAFIQPDRIDEAVVDRLLMKVGERLNLLSAPSVVDREYPVERETLEHVIDVIRRSVPMVVLDLPSSWMPWSKSILTQADEVVIVALPDLASLRNAKNMIDLLKAARPNDRPPILILNQVGLQKRPEIPVTDFAKAAGVEPTMVIPFDAVTFGTASGNGKMVAEVNPKSKAAPLLAALAERVAGRQPPPQPKAKLALPFVGKLSLMRKK
ncbi:MAG: AAA family ATPase [Hyphomicrobiales bacterium]